MAARHLASHGLSVVCLEQRAWHDASAFRGSERDWRLTSRKQWTSNPNIQSNAADYPVNDSYSDVSVGMCNGVGGGTIHLDDRVRESIGYPSRKPVPVGVERFPEYVAEGLLDHVMAAGNRAP